MSSDSDRRELRRQLLDRVVEALISGSLRRTVGP